MTAQGVGRDMSSTHSGRRTVTDVAGRWWRQADQFDWLSGYLHARGLAKPTRRLMAVVSGALIFMALGVLGTLDTAPVLTQTVSLYLIQISDPTRQSDESRVT